MYNFPPNHQSTWKLGLEIGDFDLKQNGIKYEIDYDFFSKPYAIVRFCIQKEISDIAGMGNDYCQWI